MWNNKKFLSCRLIRSNSESRKENMTCTGGVKGYGPSGCCVGSIEFSVILAVMSRDALSEVIISEKPQFKCFKLYLIHFSIV